MNVISRHLILVCLVGTAVPASAQERGVTLDEARRLAERVQPNVVQALGAVRNAEAQVRSAKGAYLPNLNASSGGTAGFSERPTVNSGTGTAVNESYKNVNVGLSASMDLFTGFRRGADSRFARATQDAAEAGLVDARYQTRFSTTQQFFVALANQQLVRVREASVRRADEQLKLAVAKLRAGSATRSDSLRSIVTLGNARLALVNAQADVATAQAELGRQIGFEGRVAAADDSAYYQLLSGVDSAALRNEVLTASPRVQSTEADASAAEASLKAAKAAYWPTVTLGGATAWTGTDNLDYRLFNNRQLTLGVNWNLFNRFNREQTVTTRASSADEADAVAQDTRREVQSSLTSQLALLDAAALKIDIAQTSVTAASEDHRVVNERYRLGAATILDVLNSQEALTQAEVDAITARFDYWRAKAQIEALIGRDL